MSRDGVTYAFNPTADNALDTLKDSVAEYIELSSKQYTVNARRPYHPLEASLDTMRHFEKHGHKTNFINLSHFNGSVFLAQSEQPLYDTVREVNSLIRREDMPQEETAYDNVIQLSAAVG